MFARKYEVQERYVSTLWHDLENKYSWDGDVSVLMPLHVLAQLPDSSIICPFAQSLTYLAIFRCVEEGLY